MDNMQTYKHNSGKADRVLNGSPLLKKSRKNSSVREASVIKNKIRQKSKQMNIKVDG